MGKLIKEVLSVYETELKTKLDVKESDTISTINAKKAQAAFNSQISGLEGHIIDLEIKVDEMEIMLSNKLMPTSVITDTKSFINGINMAQAELDKANADLEKSNDSLKYYQNLRSKYFGA